MAPHIRVAGSPPPEYSEFLLRSISLFLNRFICSITCCFETNTISKSATFVNHVMYLGPKDGLFSLEIMHGGFFQGEGSDRGYISGNLDYFDGCEVDAWSML